MDLTIGYFVALSIVNWVSMGFLCLFDVDLVAMCLVDLSDIICATIDLTCGEPHGLVIRRASCRGRHGSACKRSGCLMRFCGLCLYKQSSERFFDRIAGPPTASQTLKRSRRFSSRVLCLLAGL